MNVATKEQAAERAERARGSKLSALIYDPAFWVGERAGMADRRRAIVSQATGSTLELGAGTGLNFDYYPTDLDRLVLTEPETNMADRLRRRVEASGRQAEIVRAPGELLPFDDNTFDTVVGTLVLCTVEDPSASIAEARRVLKPGGKYLLIEHVRSDSKRLARWQDRMNKPWGVLADGCNCNRDTASLIEAGGFDISAVEDDRWRMVPPLVKPLIYGRAVKLA
ncbi:MAG: class I SAM-dependent methyltransferase [Solirubrobacterales bacterium]